MECFLAQRFGIERQLIAVALLLYDDRSFDERHVGSVSGSVVYASFCTRIPSPGLFAVAHCERADRQPQVGYVSGRVGIDVEQDAMPRLRVGRIDSAHGTFHLDVAERQVIPVGAVLQSVVICVGDVVGLEADIAYFGTEQRILQFDLSVESTFYREIVAGRRVDPDVVRFVRFVVRETDRTGGDETVCGYFPVDFPAYGRPGQIRSVKQMARSESPRFIAVGNARAVIAVRNDGIAQVGRRLGIEVDIDERALSLVGGACSCRCLPSCSRPSIRPWRS